MRLLKIAATFFAFTAPVLAIAPASAKTEWTESRFTRNGDEYVVKSAQVGEITRLKGHVVGKFVKFDLNVRGDRVRGIVNNTNVEFRRSDWVAQIASR
ncbi:hypothetical protein [Sphingomonas sp. KC8]|uniref:hypothetical protein n=1 Tax=Sphingomonas sp. KC8 TaxID=1030157 RepID=UPI000248BB97|nr:hypothetical protein [Sphingomonas sp. KC8]ARS28495.1 hypothetical protein KC8_14535 [Sphingomonas sp. KC8]